MDVTTPEKKRKRGSYPSGVAREDILEAIAKYDAGERQGFGESVDYDLLFQDRRYPPKAIAGIAGTRAKGRPLKPEDFSAGEGQKCFNELRRNGFEIVPKNIGAYLTGIKSRRRFIEAHGAKCTNWNWSWSFVNDQEKFVVFGAWDTRTIGDRAMIFTEEWRIKDGTKRKGYQQSREHIRLVEEEGYRLMTFPMLYSKERQNERGEGPAKIGKFTPQLTEKRLIRSGIEWYAVDLEYYVPLAEEISNQATYPEGLKRTITVNAYERDAQARRDCIAHFGTVCAVCSFDFEARYGEMGKGFIHVHHITPIATIGAEYRVNPITDLIPVCPNCHAMLHRGKEPLTLEELKRCITREEDQTTFSQ